MLIESAIAHPPAPTRAAGGPDPNRDGTAPRRRRAAAALLAAGLLAVGAGGQSPEEPASVRQPPAGEPRLQTPRLQTPRLQTMGERIAVDWVLVPVVVRSGEEHVSGLPRDAFQLFVDARRIPFESFERGADAAVNLVFLQDLSGSMELDRRLDLSRRALECLMEDRGAGSRYALASFTTGKVSVDVPFTAEPAALLEAAARWRAWGTTAIHDAVTWLPKIAIVDGSGRRAAVVLTDGVDNASRIEPEAARERVRRAELPVYVVALEPPGVAADDGPVYRYRDVLGLLAEVTGGQVHAAADAAAVERACRAIADDLRYQYVLGFPAAAGGVDRYRRIRVVVTGGDYQVTYRQGYHGRAPAVAGTAPGVRQ